MEVVAAMTGAQREKAAGEAGAAMLRLALDTQEVLAAQLLRGVGVGENLDVVV